MTEIQELVAEINAAGYQVFQLFQCEGAWDRWGCMLVRGEQQIVAINDPSPEAVLRSAMARLPAEQAEDYL